MFEKATVQDLENSRRWESNMACWTAWRPNYCEQQNASNRWCTWLISRCWKWWAEITNCQRSWYMKGNDWIAWLWVKHDCLFR